MWLSLLSPAWVIQKQTLEEEKNRLQQIWARVAFKEKQGQSKTTNTDIIQILEIPILATATF